MDENQIGVCEVVCWDGQGIQFQRTEFVLRGGVFASTMEPTPRGRQKRPLEDGPDLGSIVDILKQGLA
jgi:hypothetical protein